MYVVASIAVADGWLAIKNVIIDLLLCYMPKQAAAGKSKDSVFFIGS